MHQGTLSALRSLRHRLHANPYAAGSEGFTAAAIYNFLTAHDVEITHTNVNGGFGMVAKIEGTAPAPPNTDTATSTSTPSSVLLRADMDALPLLEETPNLPHKSTISGFHHACGHDGHSTMLAGALVELHHQKETFHGTIHGLFQPAEETGQGAKQMLDATAPAIPRPNKGCYGLHNIPGHPLGTVLLTPKGVAARASCGLRFHIQGHSAHASEPEKGVSPGVVLGQLVQPNSPLALLPEQLLRDNHVPPQIAQGKLLATVVHFQLGEHSDFGILPANGSINVTCRADRTEDLRVLKEAVRAVVAQESKRGGCELIGMEEIEPFPATNNDARRSAVVEQAALLLNAKVHRMQQPFSWSEDFAHFGDHCSSGAVLFGLGSGERCPPLHSKTYDFPDELIERGVELWTNIGKMGLQSQ